VKYPTHETLIKQFKLDVITGTKQPIMNPFFILLVIVLILFELTNLKKIGNVIRMAKTINSHKLNNKGFGV